MASAEQLLHKAQYAFQSISFGESRENARNASRAKSLCKKIIRRYPATVEAAEAHAILRRLGEEAYTSQMRLRHRHMPQSAHHQPPSPTSQRIPADASGVETLNWNGLFGWLFKLPKAILAMIGFAGLFLFGIFGPLLFVPLVGFALLTGPFRRILKPEQQRDVNEFVARANAYIAEQLGTA